MVGNIVVFLSRSRKQELVHLVDRLVAPIFMNTEKRGIAFFSGFLGTGVTPLTRHNVVCNNALDPAIILDPMFVANRVDSFTWSLYSSFDIANYVAGSKDLCDGFFPIKPVVVH